MLQGMLRMHILTGVHSPCLSTQVPVVVLCAVVQMSHSSNCPAACEFCAAADKLTVWLYLVYLSVMASGNTRRAHRLMSWVAKEHGLAKQDALAEQLFEGYHCKVSRQGHRSLPLRACLYADVR